jgi:hypothetical protein
MSSGRMYETIEAEWQGYLAVILEVLPNLQPEQIAAVRRQFYAGAIVCYNHMCSGRAFKAISAELDAFNEQVKAGNA